ncbi:hypothetical protein N781_18135 [Pontibacillus halophilus JSM 076056 = DSM 19796]|uniref:DUF309 domain-containing protein n=1 Tax=Pontibacillus halophilus JSM 076056 = DSM 19796 TaxID=1385510 RepID=A0A0A5GM21_9BACI|nr:DUF309 domain-containing protein [Pontibacillus halophilus]KGX92215.1 hypothetical protein N781_18135 [Pontibacillus halophilus JSM 076056 = DSM 19796]
MYDQAYIEYLAHFHSTRDYFECHEILEDRWKEEGTLDKDSIWVGFIQLAVTLYHHRRGNFEGAKRTLKKSRQALQQHDHELNHTFSLDSSKLMALLNEIKGNLEEQKDYQSVQLPIVDPTLLTLVTDECTKLGATFGAVSDFTDRLIIDRHRERDRSEVIEERERQLNLRKGLRQS